MKWASNELELLDNEGYFCDLIFECEHRGIGVDVNWLQRRMLKLLEEIIVTRKEIAVLVGDDQFNPASDKQLRQLFESKLKLAPLEYTDSGAGSWSAKTLEQLNALEHGELASKIADKIVDLSHAEMAKSMFCEGWLTRMDKNNLIHPDFKQSGTKTSRLSCGDPKVQNFPEWMLEAMLIPDGFVGVKWDLSQIEYRGFAHYANNPIINSAYAANPNLDYHTMRADALGFPRKPIKPINFGVIYGMGAAKTKRSIIKALPEVDGDKFRATVSKYAGGMALPPFPEPIPARIAQEIGNNVLAEYHATLPEIKQLMKKIKQVIEARGYVKNFFGRRYYLESDKSYIGLNCIIQGGCADLFKQMLVEIHKRRAPYALMIDNIHDSDFAIMREDEAQQYVETVSALMKECPFRIPVLCDFELALGKWSNSIKLKPGVPTVDAFAELRKVA